MAFIQRYNEVDVENTFPRLHGKKSSLTVSVFFNGCSKHCVGCWSPETWKRKEQYFIDNDDLVEGKVIRDATKYFPLDLALLGGDPFERSSEDMDNASDTLYIVKEVKKRLPNIRIIVWTGWLWEECLKDEVVSQILPYLDIVIDGRFEIARRVEGFMYGSSNQRVIDVQASLSSGSVVLVPNL